MKSTLWVERFIQALLASGAVIDHERRIDEAEYRTANERFRFETLLSLVNAQTIESGALDATLGVAFVGAMAVLFPMFEHASTQLSRTAACLMTLPTAILAFALFRVQTDTPRAALAEETDVRDAASIAVMVEGLSGGHEANREKLLGKRTLLRSAVGLTVPLVVLWGIPSLSHAPVVEWLLHEFH